MHLMQNHRDRVTCSSPSRGERSLQAILPRKWNPCFTQQDRKSTRLNSSHGYISYAVFCLKKKKRQCRVLITPPPVPARSVRRTPCGLAGPQTSTHHPPTPASSPSSLSSSSPLASSTLHLHSQELFTRLPQATCLERWGLRPFKDVKRRNDGDFVCERTFTKDATQPLFAGDVRPQNPSPTSSTPFTRSMLKRVFTRGWCAR